MDRADRADQEDPVVETGRMETEPVDRGVEAGRIRRNQWIGELSRPDQEEPVDRGVEQAGSRPGKNGGE